MASFNTAFGLCSITDSKGLLGVSEDEEGCVVITLGKSMIIRCRLCDQKQLNSWSTALTKLTSKVVWNPVAENYVGVFDNVYLKQWTKLESSLEKVKKFKFKNEIQEILLLSKRNDLKHAQLILLYKNGFCKELESAINSSKEVVKDVLQPQEIIEIADIIINDSTKFLIIVAKFENKYRQCYCIQLEEENLMIGEVIIKLKLRRPGSSLLGFTILNEENKNLLLTLWSDGFLYSLPLPFKSEKTEMGKYIGAVNVISKKSEVGLRAISQDHLAIYGGHQSEEGAVLVIYNIKFGIIQAQTSFKMFNKPPKMWLINDNLIVVIRQQLVCVPFNLQTEKLSALVGSRALKIDFKESSEISTIVPTAVWEKNSKASDLSPTIEYPNVIKDQLLAFSSEGLSEFGICQALMNQLIEAKDFDTLEWCLNNFSDIPEEHLVKMILLVLKNQDDSSSKDETAEEIVSKIKVKNYFLNKILSFPVDNVRILKSLRRLFNFGDCLVLIDYLNNMFSDSIDNDVSVEDGVTVLEWTMALFDAFYQHFILSKDPKVLELVSRLKKEVEEMISVVTNLTKIMPFVNRLKSGKTFEKTNHSGNYSVERFQLYS